MKNLFGFIKGLLACLAVDAALVAWFAAGVQVRSGNALAGRLWVAAFMAVCAVYCGVLYCAEKRSAKHGRRKTVRPVYKTLSCERSKKAG